MTAALFAATLVSIYNLSAEPQVKPERYFLTANAGPYVRDLRWKHWGAPEASATGTFISDCASCGPKEKLPATIRLTKLRYCAETGRYVYRIGRLTVKRETGKRTTMIDTTGPDCA